MVRSWNYVWKLSAISAGEMEIKGVMDMFDPDVPDRPIQTPDPQVMSDEPEPLHPVARGIRWLIDTIRYRLMFAWGILFLAVSLALLTTAWQGLSGADRAILERLTATGSVRIMDSSLWILTQSNAETKLDPGRVLWHHDFRFEHVLELSYLPDKPVRSYLSDRSQDFADISALWPVLRKDSLFRTSNMVVKMDAKLHDLLTGTSAQAGGSFRILDAPEDAPNEQKYTMGSQFDQFWVWIDWPVHALALQWLSDSKTLEVPVQYDPDHPFDFLFKDRYLEASKPRSRVLPLIGAGFLAVFGLFMLVFAVSLLTHGMNRYISRALYIGIIVMIPFGSKYLKIVVDKAGFEGIGRIFYEEWIKSMDPRTRVGFLEPVPDPPDCEFTLLPIDIEHSRYRDVFSFFELKRGEAQFSSFDEAMKAISGQLNDQLLILPVTDQFRFFKILDNHMNHCKAGWADLFLESARAIALDDTRSYNLRTWAISAFCDMGDDLQDAQLAEFIYQQYVSSSGDLRTCWKRNFLNYYQAPGFVADLKSPEPERIRRALELWENVHHFLENVQFLAPRLKELTNHPDPDIRKLATDKWNSRTDWPMQ